MEDSLYPASSERLFSQPKAQEDRFEKERQKFKAEKPLIFAVIEEMGKRIKSYHDIDAVDCEDPEKCVRQIAVNKEVARVLSEEVRSLEQLVRMYDKK